nr:uncharacterized protein LOC113693458 [Coffea arabica]
MFPCQFVASPSSSSVPTLASSFLWSIRKPLPPIFFSCPSSSSSSTSLSFSSSLPQQPLRCPVLGAGFAGLSVAWHLLQHGSRDLPLLVDIYDEVGICAGASGVAGGLLHPYSPEECWNRLIIECKYVDFRLIKSVLDDLQLLENLCPKTPDWESELLEMVLLKIYLGIFRTFLLCVRKWGDDDDASLGALVVRMKDCISKLGQAIHKFYLTSVEDGYRMDLATYISDDIVEEAASLKQEIKDLEYSTRLSSKSPVKKDDLMDIMDSLLESPRYIVYFAENHALYAGYAELSEGFAEKLTFLKNYFCFLTLHGFEDRQLGPLLTHIKSVAVNAACNNGVLFSRSSMSRNNPIRDLLKKIIFAEAEVHKTCVQALISSKLSRQAYKEKD